MSVIDLQNLQKQRWKENKNVFGHLLMKIKGVDGFSFDV